MPDEKKTKAQLIAELQGLRSGPPGRGADPGLESLCDVIPQGVFRCDSGGGIAWANRSLVRMLGRDDPGDLVGVKLQSLLAHPRTAKGLFDSLKSGDGVSGYTVELMRADGGTLRASLTLEPRPSAGDRTVFDGLAEDLSGAEALERRERQSAVLAALSRELFTEGSVQEVLDAAVGRLAEIFPTYSSVNLVEEDGRCLVVRAHRVASAILRFGEKLAGQRLRNWRIPLDCDSVVARTIRTGHPTVCGLDFEPDEPVNETDLRTLVEALVEKKSPLRRFGAQIAEKFGDAAFLGIPFTDSAGRVTGSITVIAPFRFSRADFNLIQACSDIVGKAVEQRLLADELRASEERFRGVFENTVIGMYRTTPDGRVLMANPALVRMLGYASFEEITRRDLEKDGYQSGYSRADFKRLVEKKGEIRGLESVWRRLDGTSLHVRENAKAVRDAKGKTLYYEGTVEDVTERIEVEEALRESEQRYRFLVENSYDVFYRVNLEDESYAYLSPAMKNVLGFTAEEFVEMAKTGEVAKRIHPDDLGWLREDAAALRDNARGALEKPVIEYRLLARDGAYRWLSDSRTVVFDETGKAETLVGVTRDITERKLAEERLRESEELYRTFTEESLVGVYIFEKGRFVFVNRRMEEITGYPREELLAMDPMEIVLEEDRDGHLRERAEARARGEEVPSTYRMRIRRSDGEVRVLELRAHRLPAFGDSGVASLGNCVDITEQVRAEEDSDRHLRELRALFEGVDVLLWSVVEGEDGELYYEQVNDAFAAVEGHTPEHYNGRPVSALHPPEECSRIRNSFEWAKLGRVHTNEIAFGEGASRKSFEIRLIPLMDPDGWIRRFIGAGSDITERKRAEDALRESEKRYRFLVENTNDLFYRVNLADESYAYLSPALVKITGYGVEQFVEMAKSGELAKRIHPDDMAGVVADALRLRDNARGAVENPVIEYRLLHADGEYRWLSDARTVVYDETGKKATAIVGVSRDITERKLAEEALRESEERYRVLSEEAIVGVYIYSDARFLYANDEMANITGYTVKELLAMDTGELVHEETRDFLARRDEARKSGSDVPSRYTMKINKKDGEAAVLLVGARPIPYGGRSAFMGNCFDITQSVRASEALRESEERYRSLQDNIPVGVFRVTHSGGLVSVNPAFSRMFGYASTEELLDVGVVDLYASPERRLELLDALTEKDVVADFEAQMLRRDGSSFWVLINVRAVRDADGEIVFHDGILVDQSERRAAHERLRESEDRYRTTLDSMGDAIHVVDSELRITLVNSRLSRWTQELGLDSAVVGKTVFEVFGFLPKSVRAEYKKVFADGETFLTTERNVIGGREIITEVRKIPILKGDRVDRVVTVVRDVTRQKLNETALRDSEERYRSLQENIPVGIFRTSPEGVVLSANPALCTMFGYASEDEMLTVNVGDFYTDPRQRREFVESLKTKGFVTDFCVQQRKKDGSAFWASLNATLVLDKRGKGRHIDGILENVTERRLAQEALRESEEFSRALIERSPLGVSVRDSFGRLLSCNEAWRRIWAATEEEIARDFERERGSLQFDEEDEYLGEWLTEVHHVYTDGGYLHIPEAEIADPRPDGARWVSQHFYALKDETGAVNRVVIITEDITDRKKTETALARSEETYKSLYETTLALADSTELTDVIGVIALQATGLLGAQQCLFLLLDSDRRLLTPIYSTRLDYRDIIMGFEVPLGVGLSGKVAESGVGRYLNAGEVDEVSVHVEGTDEGEDSAESLISVPMFDAGKVLGVITLGKFTGGFTDDDLARLSVFARQSEIAVKRTKSTEELAASERTYHSLYETTLALADSTELLHVIEVIANQASIMFGSRKCIFFLVDPARAVLRPIYSTRQDYQEIFKDFEIPIGEGLSGHVALTGVGMFANPGEPEKAISVHIPGTPTQEDEQESLISVPMFDDERVLGVITIGKFDAVFREEDLEMLTVFARQAEIAVKRTRKSEDLARSEETYRSLYETTLALADKTDPLKVIKVIADQASALARASDCTVYRLDDRRGVLRPIYCNDPTATEEIMNFEIPLGEGVSGRVAQTGEMLCLNLGDSDDISVHVPGTSEEVDKRESVLSVPMFDSGRVIGVISINKEDDVFTEEDAQKLSIFARQAEIAVLRAEDRSALAESEDTYHRLYETTLTLADETDLDKIISQICDQATRLLDSIYCTYFTFDATEGVLVPFYSNAPRERDAILGFKVPLGVGLSGKVALERAGACSNYTDADRPVVHVEGTDEEVDSIESVISEPVMDSETLLGVITIGAEGKLYDESDLDKLSVFARLASIAIKRAQNRQALERSEDTYRTLYETTMTLADETDLERVLAKIADNARTLMNAHFCNILLLNPEEGVLAPIYTNAPTSRDEIMAFRVPLGGGLGGKVAQLRRGAYSNYCDTDRPVVHIDGTDDSEEHRESVLGEPIMDGETLLGVFLIHALDRVFNDDDLAKVRVFARLTSVALKRSQYLEALEESEEKYRSLVEQATDGVVIVQDLRFVFVNTAMLAMSGYDSAEMQGKDFADFIVPEDRPRLADFYERRMRGEEVPSIYEVTGIHKDGDRVPLELNVGLIQYSGAPADLVIVRDVRERKRAEELLRESEERYRSIWTKSPIGICLSDRTGEVTMANPALLSMLGFAEEGLVGRRFYDLIVPEEPGEMGELLGETLDTQVYQDKLSIFSGKPTELTLLKESGDHIPVEMNIDFISREKSIQYMISLITDITERKKAEEALANYSADLEREVDAKTAQLQAARRYLREVIDASPDLVTVVDADGRLEILNRAASAALGYAEEEVRGKPIGTFYFARDRDSVAEMTRRLEDGRPSTIRQVDLRTYDGSPITVELSVSPLVDEEGRFTGSVAVGRDIRELENLRRALTRSEKLAATGKLAADIAHEVNNPLGIITNYLQIARGDLDPAGEPFKTLGVIEEEVQRIARIISGLLDFYRPESAYLEHTGVNRLVEDLLMLVGIQLEKMGVAVEKDLADDLPDVLVSPDQLRQVLLNLVTNAQDAMPTGGTLSVRTRLSEGRVVISFSDSGLGIPPQNLPYIFDPFFTTKGKKGTGLGLSVSYGIVQSFDGMMEAQSAPGEGTTFTISLPAREG